MLELRHESTGPITVVTAEGDCDIYTSDLLRALLAHLDDQGRHLIAVDLLGCTFLDAPGLAVIFAGLTRARAGGGDLGVACDSERVLKVFRTTGLAKRISIYPTLGELVTGLSEAAGDGL